VRRFQKHKKTVKSSLSFFALLGSARLKADCKTLVQLTPDAKSAFTVLKGVDECGVRKVDVGGLADVIPRITGDFNSFCPGSS
jgi:hypothetical protein